MHILHVFLISWALVKLLHLIYIWSHSGKYMCLALRTWVSSAQPQSCMFYHSWNPQQPGLAHSRPAGRNHCKTFYVLPGLPVTCPQGFLQAGSSQPVGQYGYVPCDPQDTSRSSSAFHWPGVKIGPAIPAPCTHSASPATYHPSRPLLPSLRLRHTICLRISSGTAAVLSLVCKRKPIPFMNGSQAPAEGGRASAAQLQPTAAGLHLPGAILNM